MEIWFAVIIALQLCTIIAVLWVGLYFKRLYERNKPN